VLQNSGQGLQAAFRAALLLMAGNGGRTTAACSRVRQFFQTTTRLYAVLCHVGFDGGDHGLTQIQVFLVLSQVLFVAHDHHLLHVHLDAPGVPALRGGRTAV
jgi:hypothetical protein